jgi:hypothetical protein
MQTNSFESLVCDYVADSNEPLPQLLDFLLSNNIPDSLILKAIQGRSPNFGTPELNSYKAKKSKSS